MTSFNVLQGDMLEELQWLPDNYFDGCVVDPPYHFASIVKRFGKEGSAAAKSGGATGVYQRASSGFMGQTWDGGDIAFQSDTWREVYRVLKPGAHIAAFGAPKNFHRLVVALEDAGFEVRDLLMWLFGTGFPKSHNVKDGMYEGTGTALKPAFEPISLCRKPLSEKTVAKNLAKWGTGTIRIDDCRVDAEGAALGRWPANILHDNSNEVVQLFPNSKGQLAASSTAERSKTNSIYGKLNHSSVAMPPRADEGSAARFFWSPKASREDREDAHLAPDKRHPTVKPTQLMQWLCRLVTPRDGGLILDPFMGSGSTGKAAMLEGFRFTGIELSAEYAAFAAARIQRAATKAVDRDLMEAV